MKLEQIYTGCLSHAAYYLECSGEAALFDPLREVQPYLDRATQNKAQIIYVFETHFHADFVSGHLDLAEKTGAKIVYGPTANPNFKAIIAEDGQVFKVGKCRVKAIHTPGHTMESTTYLITDEQGKDHGLISGDTLFIGDVGRPDLAQHVKPELTEKILAGKLYDSLRNKILPLSGDLIIYPNHGAGSACGKNMSKETTDTLSHQKLVNYALNPKLTKEEFIDLVLEGLSPPPAYFTKNVLMNIGGYESFDSVKQKGLKPIALDEFNELIKANDILILDTRSVDEFARGFIPQSINIALDGSFAIWVGELISNIKQKIVLITAPGKEEETVTRLARVGYDHAVGFLQGGFETWKVSKKETETIKRINALEFANEYLSKPLIIDVRRKSEFDSEHVLHSHSIPLNQIQNKLSLFPKNEPFIIYCAGGYRSMIASSILKQNGFNNFSDVIGGFAEISKTKVLRTKYVCQNSML